ncbi:MAG: hypothetical protein JNN03_04860 [Rubrivivax sp.]|nr:hypothetical protein [Rubrivivax sp.]
MNPLRAITRPVRDLVDAVVLPFKALFVVGLCGTINWFTYSGTWWVKWVALGMGIAVLVAWARAARLLLVLALVLWVGRILQRRYGEQAKAQFDDWVRTARPGAAAVLSAIRQRPRGGAHPAG